jgi:uncharacterized protein (TIGR02444 family)
MIESSHGLGDESPFWRFSLRFYARSKIAAACLVLQDEAGADVNLLLFLLFLADHGRQISLTEFVRLDEAVKAWRNQVVKPLREIRRALKGGVEKIPNAVSETFRAQIKRLELESERIEQHELERVNAMELGVAAGSRTAAAQANVGVYEAFLGGFPAAARATILAGFDDFLAHSGPREN